MPKITLEVSEELSQQLAQVGDRLPTTVRLLQMNSNERLAQRQRLQSVRKGD